MIDRRRISLRGAAVVAAALVALPVAGLSATASAHEVGSTIRSVAPAREHAGQLVTISGTGFTHVRTVRFHGVAARYRVVSSHRIRATVPARATTGRVTVTVGARTVTSPQQTSVAPTLTSFTPTKGAVVSTKVTFTGTGFTAPAKVSFNGSTATATVVSATKITAVVPAGASTGPVNVTTAGSTLKGSTFTVTLGIALSTVTGPPTQTTTVWGSGFAADEAVDLYAGTTDQALVATNATGDFTYAGFVIPATSQPGTLSVVAIGRHSGLAAQTGFTVATNWSQRSDGTAHRGVNPYEDTLDTATVSGLDQQWSFNAKDEIPTSAPAVVNGVAYFGSFDDDFYALNATTGAVIWTRAIGAAVLSSPAVVNGIVYFGAYDDDVYALNATTGALVWKYATGNDVFASPAVVNGVVYIGSFDDDVYALNASTGALVWKYATGNFVYASPAVVGGTVYIGSEDAKVYALNAATGELDWTYTTDSEVYSSASVVDGTVYIGSADDNLYALEANTGALEWSYATGNDVDSPAVANGTVYVASHDGYVYAISAATGTLDWRYSTGGNNQGTPTVADGVVYIGTNNGNVDAFDTYGDLLWSAGVGPGVTANPIVVNGILYVRGGDGYVYAYSLPGGINPDTAHGIDPARLHPDLSLRLR